MRDQTTPAWLTHLGRATPDTTDHIEGMTERPCWHCGRPTHWLELNFGTSLCPGDCTDAKWAEFDEYNRTHPIAPLPGVWPVPDA